MEIKNHPNIVFIHFHTSEHSQMHCNVHFSDTVEQIHDMFVLKLNMLILRREEVSGNWQGIELLQWCFVQLCFALNDISHKQKIKMDTENYPKSSFRLFLITSNGVHHLVHNILCQA